MKAGETHKEKKMPYYKIEFCGADGKEQYRIYDAAGNAICYAQNEKQAQALCDTMNTNAQDASRWRAFIGSARIRIIGSAGIRKPEENHYAHVGMEIWTGYGKKGEYNLSVETEHGREVLTQYADIAIAAQKAA